MIQSRTSAQEKHLDFLARQYQFSPPQAALTSEEPQIITEQWISDFSLHIKAIYEIPNKYIGIQIKAMFYKIPFQKEAFLPLSIVQ